MVPGLSAALVEQWKENLKELSKLNS